MKPKRSLWILALIAGALALAACAPAAENPAAETPGAGAPTTAPYAPPSSDMPTEQPADAAYPPARPSGAGSGDALLPGAVQDKLAGMVAEKMGVSAETGVKFQSVEKVEWPDTCLGAGGPDEACGEMIVSGFRVVVLVNDQPIEVRTDLSGDVIRIVENPGSA